MLKSSGTLFRIFARRMRFRSKDLLQRSADLRDKTGETGAKPPPKHVLIVQPTTSRLVHLGGIFTKLGFDVQMTARVEDLSEAIRSFRPQIVLSTVSLPEIAGYDPYSSEDEGVLAPVILLQSTAEASELLEHGNGSVGSALSSVAQSEVRPAVSYSPGTAAAEPSEPAQQQGEGREGEEASQHPSERDLAPPEGGFPEKQGPPESTGTLESDDKAMIERFRGEFRNLHVPVASGAKVDTESAQRAVEELFSKFLGSGRKQISDREDPQELSLTESDAFEDVSLSEIDQIELTQFGRQKNWEPEPAADEAAPASDHELYREAQDLVYETILRALDGGAPVLESFEATVERIHESLSRGCGLLLLATDREQEFSISSHSVNVTVLALRLLDALDRERPDYLRIGLASLLHEVGVVLLPEKLVHREDPLTDEELQLLRSRPTLSAHVLQRLGEECGWLTDAVAQVYERENGKGHPNGVKGDSIGLEAKMIGTADLFEACIHRRPYRQPISGYQALYELTTSHASYFPDRIVKALIRSLSLYPYNEVVVLNDGRIGKVLDINSNNLSRPLIQLLFGSKGEPVQEREIVDLTQDQSVYVAKAIPIQTLRDTMGLV
jgi:HD-GYP domain-containing protein (c-di-GMP phosphodiesterase class II)